MSIDPFRRAQDRMNRNWEAQHGTLPEVGLGFRPYRPWWSRIINYLAGR